MPLCLPFSFNRRRTPKDADTPKSELARNEPVDAIPPPVYAEKERTAPKIIDDTYKNYDGDLRDISFKLHGYHELAYKEFKAAKLLTGYLEKEGFSVKRGIAGDETAFVGTFTQGEKGPVVSFNAEYDGLPKIGMACGHNLIAIASLGAALATKAWLEEDSSREGTVKLFGTPAEEGGGGKIDIINAGFYKDVDISLMTHPTTFDGCFVPTLAIEMFRAEFFGKAAHASGAPWEGINALDAMILAFNNISALRQQLPLSTRVHGYIVNGGSAANIIPDYTEGLFIVRALTNDVLKTLKKEVHKCFEGAAVSTGCKLKITEKMNYKSIHFPLPANLTLDLNINAPLAVRYESYASDLGIKFPSKRDQEGQSLGSTDQGNVTYEVPAIHAVYKIDTPPGVGNHTPGFADAAKSIEAHEKTVISSKSLAAVAVDFLKDPKFQKEVKAYFKDN